jgi:hypothetical protein
MGEADRAGVKDSVSHMGEQELPQSAFVRPTLQA